MPLRPIQHQRSGKQAGYVLAFPPVPFGGVAIVQWNGHRRRCVSEPTRFLGPSFNGCRHDQGQVILDNDALVYGKAHVGFAVHQNSQIPAWIFGQDYEAGLFAHIQAAQQVTGLRVYGNVCRFRRNIILRNHIQFVVGNQDVYQHILRFLRGNDEVHILDQDLDRISGLNADTEDE